VRTIVQDIKHNAVVCEKILISLAGIHHLAFTYKPIKAKTFFILIYPSQLLPAKCYFENNIKAKQLYMQRLLSLNNEYMVFP